MEEKVSDIYENFTLLVDGKEAFPEIIKCINNAKKSIFINMFIWRDDYIGNEIGEAILEAANRGVKVNISVDRYGVVLEKAEENKKSFFHKEQSLIEKIKSKVLEIIYPKKNTPKAKKDVYTDLYQAIMSHENISVDRHYKEDHSKYFVFDDDIVIMGGINIEDKENDQDKEWRVYQDYMIKLEGKEHVESFLHKLETGENLGKNYYFGMNKKGIHEDVFEMEDIYLDLIRNTKKELIITMAYFSGVEKVIKEILEANKRGVNVSIMIPRSANYQDDSNKATMEKLMKLSNNEINVYLSPKMVHTKMIITDDFITFGSTNINKKAFKQLDELNIVLKNVECKLKEKLMKSVKENYNMSKKITSYEEIKYNKFLSKVERILI